MWAANGGPFSFPVDLEVSSMHTAERHAKNCLALIFLHASQASQIVLLTLQ